MGGVRIELLGGFRVTLEGREVAEGAWPARRARELVQLLALADRRAMARDSVIEALWPHLGAKAGAANLRKAAHHARRALGADDAVVLRGGRVELFPGRDVAVDVAECLRGDDPARCRGELLPDAPYEAWAQEPRRMLHEHLTELLRGRGAWERLLEVEPTDEPACRALMRSALRDGRRHAAIRWYERLRTAMLRELGMPPGEETRAIYDACTAGMRPGESAFIGRATELADAAARLQSVAGTAALLVRGRTGIGKSAFCRELAVRARERGWRVVAVTAPAAGVPYAPIGAALEQLLVHGREAFDALPARTRAVLATLMPAASPAASPAGALTRHQVVAALRRALALPRDVPPTLMLVDDAHHLDEATADVLHQLVASGGGEDPVLIVLAYRAETLRTSLARGLVQLAREEQALAVTLGPLADAEIAELVLPLAPEAVGPIVAAAEGSPFFALELARSHGERLPQTMAQAITGRLAGLDADAIAALTLLAVAEDEPDLATVLALTGRDETGAFALLDAALDAGVLVVAGARYRFRHELVRQALIDEMPAHRRVQLHRDAAARLVAAGGAPELIADHWLRGARPGAAAEWLLAATRRAVAVGAFADALVQVERLLGHVPADHEGLRLRAEILDAIGDARAPDAYAAAAAAIGDPEAQELRARQALAQLKASDPDAALRTLRDVTPRTTAGRLAEALTLSAAAAIGRYADADTAAAKAAEAHRLALELGDPGAVLEATWAHALAAHAKGELPARLREYVRLSHDLPDLATRVFDGQLCVTERMLYGGLPNDEIIAFASGLAAEAQRLSATRGHAFARTLRGEAELLAGKLDEADDDFTAGARLHGQIGAVAGEALSLLGRAQVALYRGRAEQAEPYLASALLMARESEVGHHTLDRIYGTLVQSARERGIERVREAETAIRGPAETCPTCRIAFIVPATIAAARAGDLDRAHRYLADCERALEIVALPPAWHAAVEEARGWLSRAEGKPAATHFAAAADGFSAWGQPLDARRCSRLIVA